MGYKTSTDDMIMKKFFRFPKSIRKVVSALYYSCNIDDFDNGNFHDVDMIILAGLVSGDTTDFTNTSPDRMRVNFCQFLRDYDVFNKEV